jgi:hypothetical protein
VLLFGVTTMGLLGYLEPFGVFHDSWRNVGLGQMVLSTEYAAGTYENPYISGSPFGFMLLGLLRAVFPDTAAMLRAYPLLTALVYSAGIYALASAYAAAHFSGYAQGARSAPHMVRFSLLAVVSFLAIGSIFSVRINPAPQSIAFAMLPFFLAAILRTREGAVYRLVALALFAAIVLTHPITALMAVVICGAFWLTDLVLHEPTRAVIRPNTLALYGALFLSWLIYLGVWVVKSGSSFVERMLTTMDSGQLATVSVGGDLMWDLVWTHRAAMGGAALLVLGGLLVAWKADRVAAVRLLAWFGVAAAWAPMILLGEFADRGPLFASLPAALSIAFLLNMRCMAWSMRRASAKVRLVKTVVVGTTLLTAVTGFATSYPNHVGEVITAPEIRAFHEIAARTTSDDKIVYGYVPPFTGKDVSIYLSDRVRAYALGAADFSYDRLLRHNGIIAVSEGMRQAVELRGSRETAAFEQFMARLNDPAQFDLVYCNEFVRGYRAR